MQLVASWLPTVDSLSVIVGNCVVVVASLVVRFKNLDHVSTCACHPCAWGHANLLCIVPILTDDPRKKSILAVPMLVQIRGQLEEVGKVIRRGCSKKTCITSRLVRVILAQGPC